MKSTLLFISLAFLFSSCKTYQYFAIDGVNIRHDSTYRFVEENDTLKLTYDFSGFNGPVKVKVYNKSSQPLYIDWKRSALIIGDQAFSYFTGTTQVNGSLQGGAYSLYGITNMSGTLSAEIKGQEGVDFLPPNSSRERTGLYLVDGYLSNIPVEQMNREYIDGDKTQVRLKTIHYSEENSPYRLRSYLTFYTDSQPLQRFVQEHRFFISRVNRGLVGPDSYGSSLQRGDRFYTSKMSDFGKTMAVVGVVGVLSAGAVAGARSQQ